MGMGDSRQLDKQWFGKLLRGIRKSKRLSIRALAETYNLNGPAFGSWERSQRHPTVDTAREVLRTLGWDLVPMKLTGAEAFSVENTRSAVLHALTNLGVVGTQLEDLYEALGGAPVERDGLQDPEA